MAISPMKEAILRNLGKYKYLTASHIVALKVSKSRKKTTDYLRELRGLGFTNRIAHVAVPNKALRTGVAKRVRHEDLHYLTLKGAKFLDSNTELCLPDIRYPKKQRRTLSNDYIHRVSTIFMHISFHRWIDQNDYSNTDFRVYYDNLKNKGQSDSFKSETRIDFRDGRHFSPDVILAYRNADKKPLVFCLEIYNGNRTKYVVEQLKKLLWIIEKTTWIGKKMKVQKTPRILCTCDNQNLMDNVIGRIKEDEAFLVDYIEQLIFFKLDAEVWENFGSNWMNIDGDVINIKDL